MIRSANHANQALLVYKSVTNNDGFHNLKIFTHNVSRHNIHVGLSGDRCTVQQIFAGKSQSFLFECRNVDPTISIVQIPRSLQLWAIRTSLTKFSHWLH